MQGQRTVPYGYCECGCGEKTSLAPKTSRRNGWVQGEPLRFKLNHHRRLSPIEYTEQDCGHPTPCWVWQRYIDPNGYGRMQSNGAPQLAHRVYYERVNGPIADGYEPDHLCRNRACVNPAHLEIVRRAINVRRGINTKLTQADVDSIRASEGTHVEVARRFGVHPTTILRIRRVERWRPVEP